MPGPRVRPQARISTMRIWRINEAASSAPTTLSATEKLSQIQNNLALVIRRLRWAACTVATIPAVALSAARLPAQTSTTIDSVSTLTGVYTEAQAKRGKE